MTPVEIVAALRAQVPPECGCNFCDEIEAAIAYIEGEPVRVAAAVSAEREACAAVCRRISSEHPPDPYGTDEAFGRSEGCSEGAVECADAIEDRGSK